jgi:hypothetical protein
MEKQVIAIADVARKAALDKKKPRRLNNKSIWNIRILKGGVQTMLNDWRLNLSITGC